MIKRLTSPESRAVSALLLIIFIDSMGYMVSIPVFLRLLLDPSLAFLPIDMTTSLRNIIFSIAIAIGPLGYMIWAPIMGTWSDSSGRKKTLLFSLFLCCIGFILPILGIIYHNLGLILIGRFIGGLASSSQSIAQSAIGDISVGAQKAWYFAMVALAMTLSLLIGPSMGGYLSDPASVFGQFIMGFGHQKTLLLLSTPFIVTLLFLAIAIWLTYRYFYDTHYPKQPASILKLSNLKNAIIEASTPGPVRRLFIVFFFYELGWSLYYQDIGLYLTQRFHYSVTDMSYFMAYTGIWMALGLTFIYRLLINRFSLSQVLNTSLLICILSFLSCAMTSSAFSQWLLIIPGAIAVGTTYPTIMALLSDLVPTNKQGWVLGFAAAAFAAPWSFSAIIAGPLTNVHVSLPLYIATASFIAGYLLTLPARENQSLADSTLRDRHPAT